ncbi:MAG TPA: hypothetical protein VLH18_08180, partial [Candidatus Limnocylindrales bacterium]|nr:hypothetical protein [Candidatus Limnocylindrales bacterium]
GLSGSLTTMWHQIKGRDMRRLEIFFERAAVILDDFAPWGFNQHYRELSVEISGQPKQTIAQDEIDQAYSRFIGSPGPLYSDMISAYRYQSLAFLEALLDRRETYPDLNEALEAHLIIESVYASARRK